MNKKNITEIAEENIKKVNSKEQTDISDTFLIDRLKNHIKNQYTFRVKNTQVTIKFSNKADAPTIEDALVKIGAKRVD